MRRAPILLGTLSLLAACTTRTAPPKATTAPPELPRSFIRSIPEGQTVDQVHQSVAGIARSYEFGARPVVLPALEPLVHLDHDESDSLEVEWFRVGLRSRCFTRDYDHHLLEPVVYRDGRVLGAGWPFLESNYHALGFTERAYGLWLAVGFGVCDH